MILKMPCRGNCADTQTTFLVAFYECTKCGKNYSKVMPDFGEARVAPCPACKRLNASNYAIEKEFGSEDQKSKG